MKIIRTFALILVILLFANANSFSSHTLLSDKDIVSSNETIVNKSKLSKVDFIKLANETIYYMKSAEFKSFMIELIKKAAKNPATFDAKLLEIQMKGIEGKMTEIAKIYGINSKEEMDATRKAFENDDDIMALNDTMMRESLVVMVGIYSDEQILKKLPKIILRNLEEKKKMLELQLSHINIEDEDTVEAKKPDLEEQLNNFPIEVEIKDTHDLASSLSKEEFFKLVNEAIAYIKSPEFKTMIVEAIKKAAKNPPTFYSKLNESEMKGIKSKILELANVYGINSKEELDASVKEYENDPEVNALSLTVMKEIFGVMIGIYSDEELLKLVPLDIRKKLEEGRKMMETLIAPKPNDD